MDIEFIDQMSDKNNSLLIIRKEDIIEMEPTNLPPANGITTNTENFAPLLVLIVAVGFIVFCSVGSYSFTWYGKRRKIAMNRDANTTNNLSPTFSYDSTIPSSDSHLSLSRRIKKFFSIPGSDSDWLISNA